MTLCINCVDGGFVRIYSPPHADKLIWRKLKAGRYGDLLFKIVYLLAEGEPYRGWKNGGWFYYSNGLILCYRFVLKLIMRSREQDKVNNSKIPSFDVKTFVLW